MSRKRRRWSAAVKRDRRRYKSYVKALEKRVAMMRAVGLTPYYNPQTGEDGSKALSFRDYMEIYNEEKNDRVKEIEKGERKSIGDIKSKIISDQVYELSEKQAYAIFDYMKVRKQELTNQYQNILDESGNRVYSDKQIKKMIREDLGNFSFQNANRAVQQIRQGAFVRENLGLWDTIRERRKELFEMGLKKSEVRNIISKEFFYPEESDDEEE